MAAGDAKPGDAAHLYMPPRSGTELGQQQRAGGGSAGHRHQHAAKLARIELVTSRLARINYTKYVRSPSALDASQVAFAMNRAGPGHVDLATKFAVAVGLGPPRIGLSTAQQLLAAGTPFVYMTLTNDHQRATEKAHDATLKWSRSLDSSSHATMRLIGPPGMFLVESYRKKAMCRMSEDLAKIDPSLRYALPCAFSGPDDAQGTAHEELLRSQARAPLSSRDEVVCDDGTCAPEASAPLWVCRDLRLAPRTSVMDAPPAPPHALERVCVGADRAPATRARLDGLRPRHAQGDGGGHQEAVRGHAALVGGEGSAGG